MKRRSNDKPRHLEWLRPSRLTLNGRSSRAPFPKGQHGDKTGCAANLTNSHAATPARTLDAHGLQAWKACPPQRMVSVFCPREVQLCAMVFSGLLFLLLYFRVFVLFAGPRGCSAVLQERTSPQQPPLPTPCLLHVPRPRRPRLVFKWARRALDACPSRRCSTTTLTSCDLRNVTCCVGPCPPTQRVGHGWGPRACPRHRCW